MQTYLVRKSKNISLHYFLFSVLVQLILPSRKSISVNNFIHREFYLAKKILSIEDLIQSSIENFIQRSEFRGFSVVQRLFYSAQTFLQCVDCFAVQRLLSSIEVFLQCGDFYLEATILKSNHSVAPKTKTITKKCFAL